MTSISLTRNSLLKLDDCSILDSSDYIVTESLEHTGDESHSNSFISALDKSELDIELEICEEILALDDNEDVLIINYSHEQLFENNKLENIFDASESVFENHPGECIDDLYQQSSKNNKLECDIKVYEPPYDSNEETCINKPKEQLCENSNLENDSISFCKSPNENKRSDFNSHDLPSSSNASEDEFDSEVKKCLHILKSEEPSDLDALDNLSQIPQPEQCNKKTDSYAIAEIIVKSENIVPPILTESVVISENVNSPILAESVVKSESIEPPIPAEIIVNSENIEAPIPVESVFKSEKINYQIHVEKITEIKYKKRCCEKSSVSVAKSILNESNEIKPKKIKSEIQVQKVIPEVKSVKDEDELSLFATESSDEEQDEDIGTNKVLSSVVVVPETNYLDEEIEDINDSGWESMRNLSTEEDRYKLVRKCWKSSKVPNPNRNLTYHSYRKRHLTNLSVRPRTRKRKATSSLDISQKNPPKRQRSCTFLYDLNIDSLNAEKHKKKADIKNQMQSEVSQLNNIFYHQEQRLQREYYERRNNNAYGQLWNLRSNCQREIENIRQQYSCMENQCTSELDSGISKLNKARMEVLQFFQFYKGLNSEDPTVLTASQQQELEEIENIYMQFDKLYKR